MKTGMVRFMVKCLAMTASFKYICLVLLISGFAYFFLSYEVNSWTTDYTSGSSSPSHQESSAPFTIVQQEKVSLKTKVSLGSLVGLYWKLVGKPRQGQKNNVSGDALDKLDFDLLSPWRPKFLLTDTDHAQAVTDDRILEQLISAILFMKSTPAAKKKKILLLDSSAFWWNWSPKKLDESCPGIHDKCEFLDGPGNYFSHFKSIDIDAVVAACGMNRTPIPVKKNVIRVYFTMESPFHSQGSLLRPNDILASYWSGSDLMFPYGKWVYYNQSVHKQSQPRNYAQGKDKLVAIFMSNCLAANNRSAYVNQLKQHIPIDVYGKCGTLSCPRFLKSNECFEKLKHQYKFYMSFENSNCRDYITEKLFENAYKNDVVPVVMGAHPRDYEVFVPSNSFIHVDNFPSPIALAQYLRDLDSNDIKYNKYFEWKGTGEFIPTHFSCRLCAMVHLVGDLTKFHRKPFQWDEHNRSLCLPRGQLHWNNKSSLQ